MKTVKMVAKLGDQLIPVGSCNSAQARILVRDDVAHWQDGLLVLFVRQVHLAILDNNPELWSLPGDTELGIGQAEIDRRRAWFIQFMPKVTALLTAPTMVKWDQAPHVLTSECVQYKIRFPGIDPALASDQPDEMGLELMECWGETNPEAFATTLDPFDKLVWDEENDKDVEALDVFHLKDPTSPDLWQAALDSYQRIQRIQNLPWADFFQRFLPDGVECDIITKQKDPDLELAL